MIKHFRSEFIDPAGTTLVEPPAVSEPTYAEWFEASVLRSRWAIGYVAFYVHRIALLCLTAVCCEHPEELTPMFLNAVFQDLEIIDETPVAVIQPNLEIVENEQETDAAADSASLPDFVVPDNSQPQSESALLDAVAALARTVTKSKPKNGKQKGSAEGESTTPVDQPQHAVSAGSFSVWTEPENPAPGEPYRIIIQLRVPEGTKKYPVNDLEGIVVGSDGYRKLIPGTLRGFLPIRDGHVRLEVPIVSADENVEDTVQIRSRILREAQRLQLKF